MALLMHRMLPPLLVAICLGLYATTAEANGTLESCTALIKIPSTWAAGDHYSASMNVVSLFCLQSLLASLRRSGFAFRDCSDDACTSHHSLPSCAYSRASMPLHAQRNEDLVSACNVPALYAAAARDACMLHASSKGHIQCHGMGRTPDLLSQRGSWRHVHCISVLGCRLCKTQAAKTGRQAPTMWSSPMPT